MKKVKVWVLVISLLFCFSGCAESGNKTVKDDGIFKVAMAPDVGGVNDQSFNQSAWEGLKEFSKETGSKITYMESRQTSEFAQNLDKLSDGNYDLILGVGFSMSDAMYETALLNLDKTFALVDFTFGDDEPNNLTSIMFKSEEAAFLVGYIAGRFTKTNKVGFVGGMKDHIIYQFEYGFKAGILYAAKEMNKKIEVYSQCAESFTDSAKGRAIATKMYGDGCDIIFHASGEVAYGIIEVAKDLNKFVIGVDRDQSYLAPSVILTSSMKNVGAAVKIVANKIKNGEDLGGKTLTFGLKDGCVDIPPRAEFLDQKIYDDALKLKKHISDGQLIIPEGTFTIPDSSESYIKFSTDFEKAVK